MGRPKKGKKADEPEEVVPQLVLPGKVRQLPRGKSCVIEFDYLIQDLYISALT